ncbi:type II toxin-antitoxin system VapC family toxin [Nocardia coubleae]|uniref:Ribonuclease VapC n=1 Tax=Nocardia coubleae TaxID=356147 RepID=A0A846W6U6_9NOCA|nr:type II toxin-antitoxin system VapC family toxin [Nocardia coubleae]NKX88198.1 type II toxin-antitoxin system VapC family toxin [Nocardia coubleae]
MLYFDTSALVKLVHREAETDALLDWLGERTEMAWLTSALAEVELVRAVRVAAPADLINVPAVLARVDRVEIDPIVRADAAAVSPPSIRCLDAIHLATALELAADLTALVTFDKRLGEAAEAAGLNWESPGSSR